MSTASPADFPNIEKDEKTAKLIEEALLENVFLQNVVSNKRALKAMVNAMSKRRVPAKTLVTEAGKLGKDNHINLQPKIRGEAESATSHSPLISGVPPGEELFVCAEGQLEVYDGTNESKNKILGPGDLFGEMAVICSTKRKNTVQAKTKCKLWVLHQRDYAKILHKCFAFKDEDYINFLKTIPILRKLSNESLLSIRKLIRVECYPGHMPIISEGDEGHEFFIITGGTVIVQAKTAENMKIIARLKRGDFFGEGALLNNERRIATVVAEFPGVECIVLEREDFFHFLGDLQEIRQTVKTRNERTKEIIEKDLDYIFINLEDLEVKGIISKTNVGRVELVQYKPYRKLFFARKVITKAYVAHSDASENFLNEKNILLLCRSPFIIRLYTTFKDQKYLYYLQEVCLGGDLKHFMDQQKFCNENMVRFIAACIVEALDYLHGGRIVYLNLKLENLVFDLNGYVKLVGFGNAKRSKYLHNHQRNDSDSNSISNYDRCRDYRALGNIIYELLAGSPPFDDTHGVESLTLQDIKNKQFPGHVSKYAKLFIKRQWKQKPDQRPEFQKEEIDDIKNHKWFQGFSWSSLEDGTLPAPYVPQIQYATDLSNFDEGKRDKEVVPNCTLDWEADF